MPWVRVPIRKPKIIIPAEAGAIAGQLRQISEQGEALAIELNRLQDQLNAMWEGSAKERFMDEFQVRPGMAHGEVDFVSDQANRIASMKVTIWETAWEWIHVP